MTTNVTRRTALLGTVTLPAAMAPLGLAQGTEPDPAVAAYREWLAAFDALKAAGVPDDNTPEGAPLWQRLDAAEEAIAEVVPTTPEGLACKVRYACELVADPVVGGRPGEPDDYQHWSRPHAPDFVDSLLTYAGRQAGRAV